MVSLWSFSSWLRMRFSKTRELSLNINLWAAIGTASSLWASSGILARVGEIVAATFATVAGVFQAYFGRTASTWTPVNSRLKSSAPSNAE